MNILIPALQKLLSYFIGKIFIALGLTFITYTGYSIGLGQIKQYISNNFSGMPNDLFQLIMISGLGQAIGIIFGAYAFNIAMSTVSKLTFRKQD